MADLVNHPPHYTSHPSGVECITITEHMGFNLGNALKYIWRADLKFDAIEDLRKAVWYIQREINRRGAVCPRCDGSGYATSMAGETIGVCSDCSGDGRVPFVGNAPVGKAPACPDDQTMAKRCPDSTAGGRRCRLASGHPGRHKFWESGHEPDQADAPMSDQFTYRTEA